MNKNDCQRLLSDPKTTFHAVELSRNASLPENRAKIREFAAHVDKHILKDFLSSDCYLVAMKRKPE
jgi:hypothetical protein